MKTKKIKERKVIKIGKLNKMHLGKVPFLWLLFFTMTPLHLWAQEVQLQMKTSAQEVTMEESFQITLEVKGKQRVRIPQPQIDGFRVVSGPFTSQQISSINGRMQITASHTYVLIPTEEGTFNIPPFTVQVKDEKFASNELTIKVLPAGSEKSDATSKSEKQKLPDVFIVPIVSNKNPYVGEQVNVSFKLYTKVQVGNLRMTKVPQFNGFWSENVDMQGNLEVKEETYKGSNYKTAILYVSYLFPQRSGQLEVDPFEIEATVLKPVQRQGQGRRGFFDDFFGPQYQEQEKIIKSQSVPIEVKSLPPNQPDNFSGLSGKGLSRKVTLDRNTAGLNEPVSVNVSIEGKANFRLLNKMPVNFPPNFEVYDPKIRDNTRLQRVTSGKKSFEYLFIPRTGGDYKVKVPEFHYFDLEKEKYVTLPQEELELKITGSQGEAIGSGRYASGKESVESIEEDIRFIKQKADLRPKTAPTFWGSTTHIVLNTTPFVGLLAFFFLYRKKQTAEKDVVAWKRKNAEKEAQKYLKEASLQLKNQQDKAFFAAIRKALVRYLLFKLNQENADFSLSSVTEQMKANGIPSDLIQQYADTINLSDSVQYAGLQGNKSMQETYQDSLNLIIALENEFKKNA